jgi:hypothetical protein
MVDCLTLETIDWKEQELQKIRDTLNYLETWYGARHHASAIGVAVDEATKLAEELNTQIVK